MKNFLRNYFDYTRSERNGALVLVFLCGLLLLAPHLLPLFFPGKAANLPVQVSRVSALPMRDTIPADHPQAKTGPAMALFPFDPNRVSEKDLLRLGLPLKTVRILLNYRAKGGRFRQPADLKKIYGLTPGDYDRLAPFIRIADTLPARPLPQKAPVERVKVMLDINRATAEEWQQLRGIGPVYARLIVNFRDKLGGFSSIDQVGDTYHLPDSVFTSIRDQLRLSPLLRQIAINTAGIDSLGMHPYLNWKQARAIVNYRREHGPFRSVEDLKAVRAIPAGLIEKIHPYLDYREND